MSKDAILQWLLYRSIAVVLIFIMLIMINFSLESVNDLHSLYMHGDVIAYNTKSVVGAAGTPVYIYSIFIGLRVLFTKGVKPPTTQTSVGRILGTFSAIIAVTGMFIAFLIPIGLIFSPYSNCHEEKLGSYYVTDLKLCKTITANTRLTKTPE